MLTAETLLHGAWYALEQAGRLLSSATLLANNDDPITGAMLAMLAREEVGRSTILRELAKRVEAGEAMDVRHVNQACEDHLIKQSKGAFSTTLRAEPPSQIHGALGTIMRSETGSSNWLSANQVANDAIKAKWKHDPKARHDLRTGSLYVDLDGSGHCWKRPGARDIRIALNEITDAVNDYAGERDRLRDDVLAEDYPKMASALASMKVGVMLPEPHWPNMLGIGID